MNLTSTKRTISNATAVAALIGALEAPKGLADEQTTNVVNGITYVIPSARGTVPQVFGIERVSADAAKVYFNQFQINASYALVITENPLSSSARVVSVVSYERLNNQPIQGEITIDTSGHAATTLYSVHFGDASTTVSPPVVFAQTVAFGPRTVSNGVVSFSVTPTSPQGARLPEALPVQTATHLDDLSVAPVRTLPVVNGRVELPQGASTMFIRYEPNPRAIATTVRLENPVVDNGVTQVRMVPTSPAGSVLPARVKVAAGDLTTSAASAVEVPVDGARISVSSSPGSAFFRVVE